MRIRVDQPEGALVDGIYLNGKRLAMCIEADDEEGWVKLSLPPKDLAPPGVEILTQKNHSAFVGDPISPEDWREVIKHGEVDIVMREVEGLGDEGLEE